MIVYDYVDLYIYRILSTFFSNTGTTLILGAICLNGIPVAMLMRDPTYLKRRYTTHAQDDQHKMSPLDEEKHHEAAPPSEPHISISNDLSFDWKVTFSKIGNRLGFHLLRNWRFLLYWISASLIYLPHVTLHWFIPDRGIEIGLPLHDAAMTITIINCASILSRVLFGLTSSEKFFSHIIILMVYVITSGLSSFLVLTWTSYWPYMFYSALYGALRGMYVIYQVLMVVDLVGKENVSLGFGLVYSLAGIMFLVFIPIFGHFNEVTDSYVTTFLLCGGLELLGGIFLSPILFLSCLAKFKKKK